MVLIKVSHLGPCIIFMCLCLTLEGSYTCIPYSSHREATIVFRPGLSFRTSLDEITSERRSDVQTLRSPGKNIPNIGIYWT